MAIFALISNGDTFVKSATYPTQPPDVPHKNLTWLPLEFETLTFDPDTEKLGPYTHNIEPTRVLFTALVIALTAGEISALKDAKVGAMAKVAFEAFFNHENRIRALELKAPITKAQLTAALKAFL